MWFMAFAFRIGHNMRPGGQLGESGEYGMGSVRVVCFHFQRSEGGSPRVCLLRIASVEP
jgi:hypothetical protein